MSYSHMENMVAGLAMGRLIRERARKFPLTTALLESWDREYTRKVELYGLMYGRQHPLLPTVSLRREYRDLIRRGQQIDKAVRGVTDNKTEA